MKQNCSWITIEFNQTEKYLKNPVHVWIFKNTNLNNSQVNEEITKIRLKCFECNENGPTIYQNLWEANKAI